MNTAPGNHFTLIMYWVWRYTKVVHRIAFNFRFSPTFHSDIA